MQVLKQVQAGAAMHLRQVKSNMHLFLIPETDQLRLNFIIVQESKFILPDMHPLVNAGGLVQVIIFTKLTLVQDMVYHFATLAAKYFFCHMNFFIGTGLSAMVTMQLLISDNR